MRFILSGRYARLALHNVARSSECDCNESTIFQWKRRQSRQSSFPVFTKRTTQRRRRRRCDGRDCRDCRRGCRSRCPSLTPFCIPPPLDPPVILVCARINGPVICELASDLYGELSQFSFSNVRRKIDQGMVRGRGSMAQR